MSSAVSRSRRSAASSTLRLKSFMRDLPILQLEKMQSLLAETRLRHYFVSRAMGQLLDGRWPFVVGRLSKTTPGSEPFSDHHQANKVGRSCFWPTTNDQ